MKIIHKISLFIFLFVCVEAAFGAPEAEFGKLSKTYILNADGSREYRYSMELTLYTHLAMRDLYGESFIFYDPAYQELKIHTSYTRQKDGTIIQTPENAFVEVLPRQAADAPAYNRLKEMVVVHTGLELGATIFLDYSILTKPGYLPELDICEPVEQWTPVKDYTISISVPEDKPLHYTLLNAKDKPTLSRINGLKQVTWKIRNLPASSSDPQVSALGGDVKLLAVSTYASITDALNVLNKQLTPKGEGSLLSLAGKITEGKTSDADKLQAILLHVREYIGNSRLSPAETGFRIRSTGDVIASAYGTEAEKVNLLAGLLNAAGIQAEVAASFPKNIEINNCGLSAIRDLFVRAVAGGKTHLLTPNSATMSEAGRYVDYKQYLSLSNPGKEVAIEAPSTAIDKQYTLTVSPEKANNGYITLSLPDSTAGMAHTSYSRYNSKRTTNLLLPYKANEQYSYTLELPEGMELATPKSAIIINNSVGKMVMSVKQNGNSVEVVRTLALQKQLIAPSDYAAFRNLITEWTDVNNNQLLIKVK
ncbi:MAG: DUF3857 domain-containing protein [Tannerella sp.]|jgi:transglutaminase-like putative cysteine protease|nr:DUF3857 domain-containing protein [Tannerella sp.]